MNNRGQSAPRPVAAIAAAAILIVAALNLQIPYLALSPGPADDVTELIRIEGTETYASSGSFRLTTVSLRSVTLAEAIRGWVDTSTEVVPRRAIIPPGRSREDVSRIQSEQMDQSQLFASAAALSFLGYDVQVSGGGAVVTQVMPDVPAQDALRPGDVIKSVDGQTVTESDELVEIVAEHGVGAELHLTIEREGEEKQVSVTTVEAEDEPGRPIIGIIIQTVLSDVELPISVEVGISGIGGPSAGLMFALATIDVLDEEDLAQGRTIAGTGVISLTGEVSSVGGIPQKVLGARRADAEIFLVPRPGLATACETAEEMQVVGVEDLTGAVAALRDPEVAAERSCP